MLQKFNNAALIVLFCSYFAYAQDTIVQISNDNTKNVVRVVECDPQLFDTIPLDTGIYDFFKPPVFNSDLTFFAITGNTGHPAFNLFFSIPEQTFEYVYRNPYLQYAGNYHNSKIVRSDIPYSEWYYLIGAHREQIFKATHAQNAGIGLNFGLDIKFINSIGAYRHEHSKTNNASFYGEYKHKAKPLKSKLFVFFNGVKHQENGGIADYKYFEDTAFLKRQLVPVWLESAYNTYKSAEFVSETEWKSLSLKIRGLRQWFLFTDNNPFNPWYPQTIFDTVSTFDSLMYKSISADVKYRFSFKDNGALALGVIGGAYGYFDTLSGKSTGFYASPYAKVLYKIMPGLSLTGEAQITDDRAFGQKYYAAASVKFDIGCKGELTFNISDYTTYPYRQDLGYSSNHFWWKNQFGNTHYSQIFSGIKLKSKINLAVDAYASRITGLIYYNKLAEPAQHEESVYLFQTLIRGEGKIGFFNFNMNFAIQKCFDDNAIIRLPLLLGNISPAINFKLFGGKITAMAGAVVNGRSSARIDSWMPVTRVFYYTDSTVIRSYLWADPFLLLMLKQTRFMVKYEHASAWIAGFGQYAIPGYPMNDPAIKFAVAWRFME